MLKYMKKGTTVDNMIETVDIIQKYKARLNLSFILGWDNLTKPRLEETKP